MDSFGASVSGTKELNAVIRKVQRKVDVGTKYALKKVQGVAKTSIKSRMRGRPRWDHRGASSNTGQGVNLMLNPKVVKKSGGPGKLTGDLARSIRGSKVPRSAGPGAYSAVVMSGGQKGYQNNYKGATEAKYPFFAPGIKNAEPKMPAIWEAAWAKASARP
jgi:hypothetical protein